MDSDEDVPVLIDHEPTGSAPQKPISKVPLTIITGFLGSGMFLQNDTGTAVCAGSLLPDTYSTGVNSPVAIIMNEFGDTADIEGKAISVSGGSDPASLATEFLELANGCLCCSVKDSGAAAIEQLMRKSGAFDYIMLETTGLADPGPIAAMFWHNEDFSDQIILDGVVCVVDGVFGLKGLDSEDKAASRQQIALADVILVNKMDLAGESDTSPLVRRIAALNPVAPLIRTAHGKVDLAKVLNIGAYRSFKPDFHEHTAECEHDHEHDLESVSSAQVSLPVLTSPQLAKLDEWIRSVLWESRLLIRQTEVEVLRCKGIYSTTDGKTYILQGVQTLYDVTQVENQGSEEAVVEGKLVFIGRGLGEVVMQDLKEHLGI